MFFDWSIGFRPRTPRRGDRIVPGRQAGAAGSLLRAAFFFAAAATEAVAILASALVCGEIYHALFYHLDGMAGLFLALGSALAFLFVAPGIVRDEYSLARFSQGAPIQRVFMLWNVAFGSALVLAFLSKTSAEESRATVVLFYFVGFASVAVVRIGFARLALRFADPESPAARRIFLVGFEEELVRFAGAHDPPAAGFRVVAAYVLRSAGSLGDDLALAAASARLLRPEAVYILVPWSQTAVIERCVDAFLRVPASIHLGPERVFDRFADVHIDRAGPIASIRLVGRPLTALEVALKRLMDMVGATVGLILLSPVLLAIAALIWIETRGPALFTQKRYGFNQEPFRIYKFRSMRVAEDGREIRQASKNDPRITRIGSVLRRWSLDELPQLLNVLKGDMSLVGPRPHALAHDQQFEPTIALYARRHNVKPGMTGWAQVNGLRGEIDDDEQLRRRVEHDLHYIDHWSFSFDLKILLLTILSPKAYRNAR